MKTYPVIQIRNEHDPIEVEATAGAFVGDCIESAHAVASLLGETVWLTHNDRRTECKPKCAPSAAISHRAAQMATRLRQCAHDQPDAPVHGSTVRLLLEALAREVDGR